MRPVVLVLPTKEHPAQVEKIVEDVPVARIERTMWSGMWTSKKKQDILARLDVLIVSIKKARQRANRADLHPIKIGKIISQFLLHGPKSEELDNEVRV